MDERAIGIVLKTFWITEKGEIYRKGDNIQLNILRKHFSLYLG